MERETFSPSDVRIGLIRLLKEQYPEGELLQSLLEEELLGLDSFDISLDGISLKIENAEARASIDQKLTDFFQALEKKTLKKEEEKQKDREIEELKEKLRSAMERIGEHEKREVTLHETIRDVRTRLDLARQQIPPYDTTPSPVFPFQAPAPSQPSSPSQNPMSRSGSIRPKFSSDPEYDEASYIFYDEITPLYRAFAVKYKCAKRVIGNDIGKSLWILKKVAAVLDTQKGVSYERGQARQVIAQEKSLKQKMLLIADFIKKFM